MLKLVQSPQAPKYDPEAVIRLVNLAFLTRTPHDCTTFRPGEGRARVCSTCGRVFLALQAVQS